MVNTKSIDSRPRLYHADPRQQGKFDSWRPAVAVQPKQARQAEAAGNEPAMRRSATSKAPSNVDWNAGTASDVVCEIARKLNFTDVFALRAAMPAHKSALAPILNEQKGAALAARYHFITLSMRDQLSFEWLSTCAPA